MATSNRQRLGRQKKLKPSLFAAQLRRRGEAKLRKQRKARRAKVAEVHQLLDQLERHQIELEVQNAELRAATDASEALSKKYNDLYDFSPAGYCTINKKGFILESNLTAGKFLGWGRRTLLKKLLIQFILPEDQEIFRHYQRACLQCRSTGETQICELRMLKADKTVRWARLEWMGAKAIDGAPVCRIVLSDITRYKQAQAELQETSEQLRFETLLAELSAKLINLPAGEVDRQIEDAQQRVCDALGLDVSSLWQWRPDNPVMHTLTHYYRPLGGPPVPQTMKGQDYFPWCQRQVLAGKVVVVSSLADLPAEAARDREVFSHYGLKTTLTIPLSVGGGPVFGSVNFNDMRTERRWSEALVQRLQLVAQIFANALARKVADQALRESEARLSLAADAAGVGLWSLNLATDRFWLTDKTREMFSFLVDEEVTFERFLSLVHPDDQASVRETVRMMVQARGEGQVQYRAVLADGRVRWMLSRGRVRCGASGEPDYLMGLTVDITARKQAEGELRQLSQAVEQSTVLVVITDTLGRIVYVNRRFSEVTGYSFAECLGQNPRFLKSGESPSAMYQELWATITSGRTWRGEFHNRRKNGELYWESAVISALLNDVGQITHFVAIKEDITERKQSEGRMQDLSRRLIRAHEAERARLARELHDDLTQRLARLAIDAGQIEPAAVGTLAAETMRSIRHGLVQLSEDIHALSYRLHPSVLEDLGLEEALRAECERFARREAVRIEVDLRKPPKVVPLDPALCLFRVAQEALHNVVRHAQARTVKVSLRTLDDGLQLAVYDDGIGFVPALQQARPSLGLASMRERIALLAGELDIETAPGHGTTIVAWVPLEEPSA